MTMAWRATMKMRRNFEQLFDVTIQPLLFTAMFAGIFGGAISGSVEGYLPMIIPGLVGQTVLTACVATGVQLREDMDKGVFDRFKVLPIARIAPLAGPMVADMLRYADREHAHLRHRHRARATAPAAASPAWSRAILLAIIAGWSLAWIFTWFGTVGRSAQGVQAISLMVMFPLTFLSNAFVPTDTMPPWLQAFADAQPGLPHHLGDPRPGQRRPGHRPGRLGAARLRRRRRDLRPAVGAELHPEDVSRPTHAEAGARSASDAAPGPGGRRTPRGRRPAGREPRRRRGSASGSHAITGKHAVVAERARPGRAAGRPARSGPRSRRGSGASAPSAGQRHAGDGVVDGGVRALDPRLLQQVAGVSAPARSRALALRRRARRSARGRAGRSPARQRPGLEPVGLQRRRSRMAAHRVHGASNASSPSCHVARAPGGARPGPGAAPDRPVTSWLARLARSRRGAAPRRPGRRPAAPASARLACMLNASSSACSRSSSGTAIARVPAAARGRRR